MSDRHTNGSPRRIIKNERRLRRRRHMKATPTPHTWRNPGSDNPAMADALEQAGLTRRREGE